MIHPLMLAVAIVAHEPGYVTSLANHLSRWLKSEAVAAKVVPAAEMAGALDSEKIAFLIGFNEPTEAEMKTLRAFRARGGKLVVFHSASPALAELMGVKPIGYKTAPLPGNWSSMKFVANRPEGFPAEILQTSTVLQRAMPLDGRSRVVAEWLDRSGRPTGEAAWLASPAGFWMTHVLLADGDEHLKARLVAAMCRAADASLWSPAAADAREKDFHDRTKKFALAQVPRKGEIHAVWDHSGCGLYPGNWAKTIRLLRESRVTDLFVNVAGAGFAHYASEVLPRSKTFQDEGDQLSACLTAARDSGIRVHAWILCFTGTRSTPDRLKDFAARGWRVKNRAGTLTEYLDPANMELQRRLWTAIDELQANYPALSGIHLDFVRFYEGAAEKPINAAEIITGFITEARRRVKVPRWLTTAVLGKYPASIASVGQDWEEWVKAKLVDYVVPMDYTDNLERFKALVAEPGKSRALAGRTIAGIGVTANESRLDARQVMEEILIARKHRLAGVALFDLDVLLQKRIFPYLTLGIW